MAAKSVAELYGYKADAVKDVVKITADGGIVRHVLLKGTGPVARVGQDIQAHYDGKLTNGTQFDSSRKRGRPFGFKLGGGRVIAGWDKGFVGMNVGDKAILEITSEYGYGAEGAGGVIPPHAKLLFEVELLSVG